MKEFPSLNSYVPKKDKSFRRELEWLLETISLNFEGNLKFLRDGMGMNDVLLINGDLRVGVFTVWFLTKPNRDPNQTDIWLGLVWFGFEF